MPTIKAGRYKDNVKRELDVFYPIAEMTFEEEIHANRRYGRLDRRDAYTIKDSVNPDLQQYFAAKIIDQHGQSFYFFSINKHGDVFLHELP